MKSSSIYKEQGSAHVIIIAVLAVALVAAIGVLFWQNLVSTDKSNDVKTTIQSNDNAIEEDKQETTIADPNEGYLVIDAWNIRFKPSNTSRISYEQQADGYWFTTDKWKNMGGLCNTHGGVLLVRMNEKSTIKVSSPVPLNNEEKIGDYYFYYSGPQDACVDAYMDEQPVEYQTIKDLMSTIEAKK